jgi:Ca-activated chloride channel homolog
MAGLFLYAPVPAQFRVTTRLVEVNVTVRDSHGRYVDGLDETNFDVFDNGAPQQLVAFEPQSTRLNCSVVIDTTGSMAAALPVVKNSIVRMLEEFRPEDEIAVYSFSGKLQRLQNFTTNRLAAKQAVLRTRAEGATALFDSISEAAQEIAGRAGKKALVVFTDGADNASLLTARSAVQRAKKAGVPVYSVAEGEALANPRLLSQLKELSASTGGQSHRAGDTSEIGGVFHAISEDLQHTYMLAYKPPPANDGKWRAIRVAVKGVKEPKLRAKEGYIPE